MPQEKQNARDTAEKLLLKIGSQLSALAAKNNDPMLGAKVTFDKSSLDKMAVSDLLTLAKTDAPRLAIADQHVATLSLPAAIGYVRGILRNEADKMMEVFRDSQPDFYVSHFAARVIIDRPGTHASKKTAAPAQSTPAPTATPA